MNSPQADKNSLNPLGLSKELIDLFARAALVDGKNVNEYNSIMKEIASAISSFSISNPTEYEKLKNSEQFKLFEFAMNHVVRDEIRMKLVENKKVDFSVSEKLFEAGQKESDEHLQKQKDLGSETQEKFSQPEVKSNKKIQQELNRTADFRQSPRFLQLVEMANKLKGMQLREQPKGDE